MSTGLTVQRLNVARSGKAILHDVDLTISPGKITALLGAKANVPGRNLNAFERRMVEIARATVGSPRLIMMDEPGAGLSQDESEHLRQVIRNVHRYCGAQVLLVDHDVDLISATCTATLVLDFGSPIAYGPTPDVLADPKVRAAYLGVLEESA